jgi:pilus assembly protein Flp/PilA
VAVPVAGAHLQRTPNNTQTQHKEIPKVMNTIKNFLKDETGLELSEYAVAAALIAAAIVAAFTNLGSAITSRINALAGTID